MKKILMFLAVTMLLLNFSGLASAFFEEGHLIQAVYQKGGANEVLTDLGVFMPTAPYSGPTVSLGNPFPVPGSGAFSGATWADLQVSYFVKTSPLGGYVNHAWTSGPSAGQINGSRKFTGFNASVTGIDALYSTFGTAQAALDQANLQSYVTMMDLGDTSVNAGYFSAFIPLKNGEMNLAALGTGAPHVDSYLYYYDSPNLTNPVPGVKVATIRTYPDGTAELVGTQICTPNAIENAACGAGFFGTQTRTCSADGSAWGSWDTSSCQALVCTPNAVESAACGAGLAGTQTRSCNANGTGWSSWDSSSCVGGQKITSYKNSGGVVTPTTTVAYGSDATFTATPDAGFHIQGVKIDGADQGTIPAGPYSYTFLNVKKNHTIQVTFAPNQQKITSYKNSGGVVTPTTTVAYGSDATFTATPDAGYQIHGVKIDGADQGTIPAGPYSYTFLNVKKNHTIQVTFAPNQKITSYKNNGGTVTPTTTVVYGSDATFSATPNAGYHVQSVKIDGVDQGTIPAGPYSYTFINVKKNHTIQVTFAHD